MKNAANNKLFDKKQITKHPKDAILSATSGSAASIRLSATLPKITNRAKAFLKSEKWKLINFTYVKIIQITNSTIIKRQIGSK